jgi:formate dehydrogenase iron-sulfur subunit
MSLAYGMLIDTTLCTGCEECVQACKTENHLGQDLPRRWKRRIDDLSSTRFTTIVHQPGMRHVRQLCRHCLAPACASACIVGALQKTPEGAVSYDDEKCIGCRYCMMACPYGVPRYEWEAAVPYVRKCTFCRPRIEQGRAPACVEACRYHVATFGERSALVAEARRRIAAKPHRYVNRVFGETEIGGTSVLYLSDISLDFLAWQPGLGDTPLPDRTWAALTKVPPLILGVGGLLAAIHWLTARSAKVAAAEAAAAGQKGEKAP